VRLRSLIKTVRWFLADPLHRLRFVGNRAVVAAAAGMHPTSDAVVHGQLALPGAFTIGRRTRLSVPSDGSILLGESVFVGDDCELSAGSRIQIGAHTSLQNRSIILGDVTIGAGCVCGPNLYLSSAWHHFRDAPALPIRWQDAAVAVRSTSNPALGTLPIFVGEDCWFGIHVVVAPGVTIGRGCVIGANAVVTRDVPPYSVVAGAPARVIRKRLDFQPPKKLDASRPEHLPYFYAGFAQWGLSVTTLDQALVRGGWRAASVFTVALAIAPAQSIRMSVVASKPARMQHGAQWRTVEAGESEVSFEAIPDGDGLLHFEWSPQDPRAAGLLAVLQLDQES
jgi:acetyltransferase-like isoleucine patch superfamily enzyme